MKVGLEVSDLVIATCVSLPLFDEMEKPRRVSLAIDKINQRWGASAIYFGSMHDFRHQMDDKIALAESLPKSCNASTVNSFRQLITDPVILQLHPAICRANAC